MHPSPIDDPRRFSDVLRDWIEARGTTAYALGKDRTLGVSAATLRGWMGNAPCPVERQTRALMTLIEEGRA